MHPSLETRPKQEKPLSEPQTSPAVEEAVAEEADKTNHLADQLAGVWGHLAQEAPRKAHPVEAIHNPLPQEMTQRNPPWVVSQMDTAERKFGLVENQTSNGQDWRIPMQLTFRNHLKCGQAAQKLLLAT